MKEGQFSACEQTMKQKMLYEKYMTCVPGAMHPAKLLESGNRLNDDEAQIVAKEPVFSPERRNSGGSSTDPQTTHESPHKDNFTKQTVATDFLEHNSDDHPDNYQKLE